MLATSAFVSAGAATAVSSAAFKASWWGSSSSQTFSAMCLDGRRRRLEARTQRQQLRDLLGRHVGKGEAHRLPHGHGGKVAVHLPEVVQRHIAGPTPIGLIQPPVDRDHPEGGQKRLGADDFETQGLILPFEVRLGEVVVFQEMLVRLPASPYFSQPLD